MNASSLRYTHFEKLPLRRPVDRIGFISNACQGLNVLDIGCYDETALVKRETEFWLHSRICAVANRVIGVDSSTQIPDAGVSTATNGRIFKSNASTLSSIDLGDFDPDVIVAGEFIEHISDPISFISSVKQRFPSKMLVLSTPNACSVSNGLMGAFGWESQHPDHLHNFTFKTLHTSCARSGLESWEIVPYRFFATEMILRSRFPMKQAARIAEGLIRAAERLAPALSFGYIVVARI